jgi:DNA-binding transcriptional LysR family regulator
MSELHPSGLRVLLAVAERGSFTAAAAVLGYTQSAVSRQVAALEATAGQRLFDRHRSGVRLTAAGSRLLPRARHIVDELDAALADARALPTGRVRLGTFPIAAASIVPDVLVQLQAEHPELVVTLRESTTPALVRSVRAGTVDLALVAQSPPFRPLDAESPALDVSTLVERDLVVAVGPGHPLAGRRAVEVEELAGQVWVASVGDGGDSLLGVWPGLAERADVRYVVRDWLTKLRLVATGLAITTVSTSFAELLPDGVRTVSIRGEPHEIRRLSLVRLAGQVEPPVAAVIQALQQRAGAND